MHIHELNHLKLKRIALVLMILDHLVSIIFPELPIIIRWFGRISIPLFLYCCAWGFDSTNDLKKYIFRLYIFSVITSFVQYLFDYDSNFIRIMFSLVVLLTIIKKSKKNKEVFLYYIVWQIVSIVFLQYRVQYSSADVEPFFLYILPALTGSIYNISGGLVFISLGLIFYYTKGDKKNLAISFIVFDILYFIFTQSSIIIDVIYKVESTTGIYRIGGGFTSLSDILIYIVQVIIGIPVIFNGGSPFFSNIQWMMILALPFIILCNDKKIRSTNKEKWFFYWFYPLHLLLFHIISQYIQ